MTESFANITDFLTVCLREEERAAKAAVFDWPPDDDIALLPPSLDVGVHLHRWNPTRVLAGIEATKRLIGNHQPDTEGHCRTCAHWTSDWLDGFKVDRLAYEGVRFPCLTLRLVALPYAEHDGYQDGWKP